MAALLHAGFLALALMAPPAAYDPARRAANAVEVRLYTVAGGPDAQSDAPLFEPPMSGAPVTVDPQAAAGGVAGATPGADESAAREDAPESAAAEPEPAGAGSDEPERAAPQSAPVGELAAETPAPASPGESRLSQADPAADGPPADATQAPAAPRNPGAPVATTQLDAPEPAPGARRSPPSFAAILARAQTRLDPADFQVAQLLGGVRGASRESFCLSSASGNRDAMDCPDEPNAASAELARYGLSGLGEEMPEFDIDMDRLEYKLRTLGADDNAVTRILTALGEARHEAVYGSALRRQLGRDRSDRNVDNLGNPRMDTPMPANPGG